MQILINNFSLWFGENQILHSINLDFRAKKISAIIGPSGCGKTTLLQAINRTAELSCSFRRSGSIFLNDADLYDLKDVSKVRQTIGMVFQKPVTLPFSVKENVLFGPRYYGQTNKHQLDELAEKYLTLVGLWPEVKDKLSAPAKDLSGGQQQRLSIARVLAVQPEVVLLDEPCSSLDIQSTKLIEELLQSLSAHYTIILVTHNLAQARRIAADTLFMSAGRAVEKSETNLLFSAPSQSETQDFLAMQ